MHTVRVWAGSSVSRSSPPILDVYKKFICSRSSSYSNIITQSTFVGLVFGKTTAILTWSLGGEPKH